MLDGIRLPAASTRGELDGHARRLGPTGGDRYDDPLPLRPVLLFPLLLLLTTSAAGRPSSARLRLFGVLGRMTAVRASSMCRIVNLVHCCPFIFLSFKDRF